MSDEINEEVTEEVVETEEVSTPEEDDRGEVEEVDQSEPSTEEPGWEPKYTYKVLDKDHEFDDFIKPIVNKDNYEHVRDLYEKAHGLDHVKSKKALLEEDVKRLSVTEQQLEAQNRSLGYMGSLIKARDYHTLFNELKIPEQDLMKYALDRVNYQSLPPEEKAEYDSNIESRQRLRALEMQNQQFQAQMQNNAVQARMAELDNSLSSSQMKGVINEFDARAGKPGAFKEEVIRRGQMAYHATGTDIPVAQAVQEVVRLFGTGQGTTAQGTENSAGMSAQKQTVPQGQKPVIPNIRSGGHSPARKLVTSIDGLKKLADSYN